VYLTAARAGGRRAGVLAAMLLAFAVMHLRDSHFFTVDISLTFFSVLSLYCLVRVAQGGRLAATLAGGVAFGLAVLSKYTAIFLAPLIALAHLLSPRAPRRIAPLGAWLGPIGRTAAAGAAGVATFLLLDPLVIQFYDKFRQDLREQVTGPLLGSVKPIFFAHFADIGSPQLYWFTNLLWWGLGPAFEIAALAAVVWLFIRRDRVSLLLASFPVVFFLVAGRSVAPFLRYAVPLAPMLSVALGVAGVQWLQRPRWRRPAIAALALVLATTIVWAAAYMNVYATQDVRLTASRWLTQNVPRNSKILVEPHHNIPPTGSYLTSQTFYGDYVLWGRGDMREDYYTLFSLDTYRYLYNGAPNDDERRAYIAARLALADWILIDDTYVQWYAALPESEHAVMKQHYRDLFSGRLGFELVKTFEVYPSLFGWPIKDDGAELTFRLFDHPRIYVFRRVR
jgi:4-amino-4-deoxy-L-arabinose transferase-like glycosyltransferase